MRFVYCLVQARHFLVCWLDKPAGLSLCRGMKELLRTNDITVIAFAKALLDGEGIDCFEMDVNMSVLEGGIGILPRRLMVRQDDLFQARAIMRDNGIEYEGCG